ncbi:MAG: valine--tRNA ligase [Alphaproteobacteria bacterium]|nr:valine--tRNA ligase [Alphaproteobacteria bacterium]
MLDKTFDHKQIEKNHYHRWEDSGLFECHPKMDTSPYTIMMPPPNVTGTLHMGHAFTNTIQDIMIRYNRMRGKDTLWMPGTDHAGIATQMVVERKLEAEGQPSRREMGREAFLEKVWEWKEYSGGTITSQLRRLGATPDWSRERFTMDEGLSKAVAKVFVQLYKEKLIYKDNRLVNWDPKLLTAISDLEVVQKEIKGHMWYIRYPVEGDQERTITIATTRPETMLGDTAIVVNPEDERYKDLIGKFAVLPIVGRLIKIIADDYVDMELGTGAMKVTPAHDFNDFEIGRRHNLEMISILDIHAKVNENAPKEYQGLDRYDARKKILAELEAQDLLEKVDNITHMVPYGDRSDLVIEPFLTEQWYCDAKTLAQPAIEAVETGKTVFVPKNWENTFFEWMRNIQPWCISRQLWWGHQIPAWYDEDGKVYVAETEEEAQAEAGAGVKLRRDDDVLDTWFSSALWPFSTLGWPEQTPELAKYYPGDVLCTGFDIIFFWVARMMMMGIHFMGDVPFKTVYMHALVRDAKGQKMSKSKGNVIDPLDVIEKYGADALRFCLTAMAAQGRDIRLSDDRIEGYRNFATKIWNATRYCEMNGCLPNADFKPENAKATINKWIVGQVMDVQKAIDKNMEEYRFNDAAGAIYQFVWGTFCDWYLEFTKPMLGEGNTDDALKQETRDTTGWVLDQILTLLNPYMPYITEELYESIAVRPKDSLLMGQPWPTYAESLYNEDARQEMDWVMRLITEIRSVRSDMNVPAGAKIQMMIKDASEQTKSRIASYEEIIGRMARIEKIELTDSAPKGSIQTILDEATIILPIAEIIDLDKERERLKKEIDKLAANINRIDTKLADEKFVNNAPAEIIAEQKARREESETVMNKLSQALKQLEAA